MKTQKTFNGSYAIENAIDWLANLQRCFYVKSATLKSYKIKTKYYTEWKCQVTARYN